MDKQEEKNNQLLNPDEMFDALITKIKETCPGMDLGRIRAAYDMARLAHSGQLRKDGSPYVTHCVAAADITVDMGLDEDSIVSALLHDVIEDTNLTHDDIARQFGEAVADIVEGVTKLTRVQYTSKEDEQMENLRKMLMAMAKDIRVILIKIADRLHNMRTMAYQSADKQRSKSLETMEIYAPIAHRLGMQRAKWELEDLSLQYLDPAGYKEITTSLEAKMGDLERFMASMKEKIQTRLDAEGVKATIYCRIKHVYSIYRKMYAQKLDINGIFDLCAFRVIVDTIPDCYNVLGIIHDMFKPVPGRFKDYISTPKPNMYQSVHTTVIGSEGIPFEVQIRTWEMHYTAEYGIAAHWKYKMGSGATAVREGDEDKFAWVRRLLESQQESDAQDFFHNLKIDMFADEVFVFSPKGDVINLPAGATPIDFAYSIHSDVGNHMVGARVNGRIVTYDHVLQNGDIVEIRTSKNAPGPSRDWLNVAKSGSARTKIKQWYKKERREENVIRGREMLEDELKHNGLTLDDAQDEETIAPILKRLSFGTIEDLYAAIGYGGVTATRVANRIRDELRTKPDRKTALDKVSEAAERRENNAKKTGKPVHGILVEGLSNCLVKFSRCCTPVPGDDIVGFITRGQGVSIHRRDCTNCAQLMNQPENQGRWVGVSWAENITDSYVTTVTIASKDRSGLVMDIATVLNSLNAKVRSLTSRDTGAGLAVSTITLEVKNSGELRYIMGRLASIPGVSSVVRNGNK
ncbi:MAG: bifunctional (p)ppGpp synthetase/guanosine-3',5'-bis(diphosphate) 3'-pyrophosphohydrolase [bacterium]|nr:bifunctional (p)ppGpp synthetase/guanosine-3',5'-bis(diphosphate) 3'-pyrophosphohydrolase [bacterium]MDY4635643.1 bifunctional (p)ppGpp synthetase/guanosine-3',5'-bis(diphosphate) 3'-pyrophosphohydrolase [Candidatus Limivicinus sp.]